MNVPRVARWLLERAVASGDRGAMLGDMAEEFNRRRRAGADPRFWYWRQTMAILSHAARQRLPRAETIAADVRFALRMWRRHPAFAVAAIVTQAVGIAVATAVLAVAYAVLVRPLPYADPGRLVQVLEATGRSGQLSYPDFLDLRRASRALSGVAGFSGGSRTLTGHGVPPERLPIVEVSEGFFETLGVAPLAGRTFTATDIDRNAPWVVILSHDVWSRRFAGETAMIGRRIMLNGIPHEVIGILPRSFTFPLRARPEFWLPLRPTPQQQERGYMHWMEAVGRWRSDLTPAQLQADLDAVAAIFAARDLQHRDVRLYSTPLREMMVRGVRPTINALLAGVLLVLVVTCATTAALLLSRVPARRRELSVRSALGASRARIVSQLACEALLLSLAGGALGAAAGQWLLTLFVASVPAQQRATLPHFEEAAVGLAVTAAAIAIAAVSGLLFGIVPALRSAAARERDSLMTARATTGRGDTRLRALLVSLQVAVSLVLLAGAGVLAISVHRLLTVPTIADPEQLVTLRLNLPPKYRTPEAVLQFDRLLVEELSALPGITGAALINQSPLAGGGNNGRLRIAGRPPNAAEQDPVVALRTISPNYFAVMQVPVVRGRAFLSSDSSAAPQVVTINRTLAASAFAGSDPLGQRIAFQFLPGEWEIVGVVGDERFDQVDRPLLPVVYFTMEQSPIGSLSVMLRAGDTAAAVAAARTAIGRLDPELPLFGVRTARQLVSESPSVFLRRATLWMLAVFAIASVTLAAVGLYGVLAQTVADRTREIGVRLALGATRARTAGLVVRSGLQAAALGISIGIAGALAASRWLSSLVFGVGATDPLVIAAAALFLLLVAFAACVIPARRALAIDPARALREERGV